MTPWLLADPVPKVCKVRDVLRILQISRRTFERLMAKGQLPIVELPALDASRRFTGESVAAIAEARRAS